MINLINIANILKNTCYGTKLWSSKYDIVFFCKIIEGKYILVRTKRNLNLITLDKFGRENKNSECILFPSKEMRNWIKFTWKKGTKLYSDKWCVVFKGWVNEDYTVFKGNVLINDIQYVYKDIYHLTEQFMSTSKYIEHLQEVRISIYWKNKFNQLFK